MRPVKYARFIGAAAAVVVAAASLGRIPQRVCWGPPSGFCNDPIGDCAFKPEGMWCNHCDGPNKAIGGVCVYKVDATCINDPNAPVACGTQRRGNCDWLGFCVGQVYVADCILFPCNIET